MNSIDMRSNTLQPPTGRKSQLLFRELRRELASGKYRPGDQFPTIDSLARIYDLSANTVVKCLDQLVHHGLLERRHGSGTYVRDIASMYAEQSAAVNGLDYHEEIHAEPQTCFVDVVVPDSIEEQEFPGFGTELVGYLMQKEFGPRGIVARLNHFPSRLHSPAEVENWLRRRVESGARAFVLRWVPRTVQLAAERMQLPVCVAGHPHRGISLPFVDFDQRQLGREIGRHLKQSGCKSVALVTRFDLRPGDNVLISGLLQELRSRLVRIESTCIDDDSIDATARDVLQGAPPVDAVIWGRYECGRWLPANLSRLLKDGPLKAIVAWRSWHPAVICPDADAADLMNRLAELVSRLIRDERVSVEGHLFGSRIVVPEAGWQTGG